MSHQFDEFSKLVADSSIPRRESLRRLGFMVTATLLGPLGAEFARAGKQPKSPAPPKQSPPPKPQDPCKAFCKCTNKKQLDQCLKVCQSCGNNPSRVAGACGSYSCCGAGKTACGRYCADLASDPDNCGACGFVCDEPGPYEYGICLSGKCEFACFEGAEYCDGLCTFLDDDPDNCGACGAVCPSSAPNCVAGVCVDRQCGPGLTWCGTGCVNLNSDTFNCGACGNACAPIETCSGGFCQGVCIGC